MPSKSTETSSGEMMMLRLDDFCLGSSLWSGGNGKIQRQRFCSRCQCQPACPCGCEDAPSRCKQECQVCDLNFEFSFTYFIVWGLGIFLEIPEPSFSFFFWDGKVSELSPSPLLRLCFQCGCPFFSSLSNINVYIYNIVTISFLPKSLDPVHMTAHMCSLLMIPRHTVEWHSPLADFTMTDTFLPCCFCHTSVFLLILFFPLLCSFSSMLSSRSQQEATSTWKCIHEPQSQRTPSPLAGFLTDW